MSMSRGASPSTERCQPVGRMSQAGARSVVQYQVAWKRSSSSPPLRPETVIRCAATVPGGSVPAAIVVGRGAVATSPDATTESSGRPRASPSRRRDGPKLSRTWESRASSKSAGALPNPMTSNSIPGESRRDRSAYSWMVRWSRRRWIDARTSGTASVMKPGLLPVLWIEVPPRAQAASTRSRTALSMLGGGGTRPGS